jgi:hypothetical protein
MCGDVFGHVLVISVLQYAPKEGFSDVLGVLIYASELVGFQVGGFFRQ